LTVCFVGVLLAVMGAACGQSVAGCGDVCPSGSSASCPAVCSGIQASCDAASAGPDFQALLTCVANASASLTALPTLCVDDYDIVMKNCGVTGLDAGVPLSDAGASADGS
jgi:hypothetical protein